VGSGVPITLDMERIQEADFTDGEIIGMDISPTNAKSPSQWEDEVAYGTTDLLNRETSNDGDPSNDPTNTSINASRGNQSFRLENAIDTRLANGQDTMLIMVTNPQVQNNGTTNMPLLGIAKVKITGINTTGHGANEEAHISFIILEGGLVGANGTELYTAEELAAGAATNTVYVLRLIDDLD